MYMTILRMLWPYLGRHLAGYAADYLQQRRERRLQLLKEPDIATTDYPPCPPCPPCPSLPVEMNIASRQYNTLWFTLSGLLLGGAFGLITYIFIQDKQA